MGDLVVGGHIVRDVTVLWEILLLEDVLWESFVIRECAVCRKVARLDQWRSQGGGGGGGKRGNCPPFFKENALGVEQSVTS